MKSYQIEAPQLSWGDDGVPRSDQFDDIYFDQRAGLEETRYVFLQHNQLAERWQRLFQSKQESCFTIAETGFGTGLNFLCAWEKWQSFTEQTNGSPKRLHFISVEKYPLSKEALQNALKMWPNLQALSNQLIANYPSICRGLHRIELDQGRVQLSLYFGDAAEGFDLINADVDAWFLDGFAPSKNPDMWNEQLFEKIKRLSHQDTSFATFTAAGIVRRGLESVGFDVTKVKGFGHKREMAIGTLAEQNLSFAQRQSNGDAWFNNRQTSPSKVEKVLIVGAGLAGCHTARALANKGVEVHLWDQHAEVAQEASGNAQGMLYPKLAGFDTPINRFYLSAYLFANRQLNQLDQGEEQIWQQTGLEQRPISKEEETKFQALLEQGVYPSNIVRAATKSGLFLPLSGWVCPQKWCQTLVDHPNITFHPSHQLIQLEQNGQNWHARARVHQEEDTRGSFQSVVFCTANHKEVTDSYLCVPTKAIKGQVSSLSLDIPLHLDHVLCQSGYVSPPLNKVLNFGSSYSLKETSSEVTLSHHQSNLQKLKELLPEFDWLSQDKRCQGRVSFRCTVTDYAPLVGPIPNLEGFNQQYLRLTKNAKWRTHDIHENLPGLYMNIGHGSRGLVSTPLAGEYLANLILNETSPLERPIEKCLHPARFNVRALKRAQVTL